MNFIKSKRIKYILVMFITLLVFSCDGSKDPYLVKTETIYPSDDSFKNELADIRITVGTEAFWTLSDPTKQIIETKKYDFNAENNYEMSPLELEKYQVLEEGLNIDGEVKARGLSNIIDINNLEDIYPIFMIPVNKAITLLSAEIGIEENIKNLEGHTVVNLPDGRVLIWGGKDDSGYSSKIYLYSPGKLAVETLNSNYSRAFHTATLYYLDNSDKSNPKQLRVLISGGENENGDLDIAEIFNPETGKTEELAPQPASIGINQSAVLASNNNFIYFFGGKYHDSGSEKYSNQIVSFNSVRNTFSQTGTMEKEMENTTATYIGGGKIIVAGGNAANDVFNTVYAFDANSAMITSVGNLQDKRTLHQAVLYNGKVYFIGGFSTKSGDNFTDVVRDINSATALEVSGSFLCQLAKGRGRASANFINANTIIVSGGDNGDKTSIKESEIIELRKNSCMPSLKTVSLNNPRYNSKSVLTSTGLTVIVGGLSNNDNSSSIMEVMSVIP